MFDRLQGEIVIGGASVAEGYYRSPDKTREEFVDQEGARWFRTGDIGELHHDGCIKIIGEIYINTLYLQVIGDMMRNYQ